MGLVVGDGALVLAGYFSPRGSPVDELPQEANGIERDEHEGNHRPPPYARVDD
jgi:hypothetical protein